MAQSHGTSLEAVFRDLTRAESAEPRVRQLLEALRA